jgi:NADH-ubiquinone oxidoreductase chain 5
MMFVVSIIFLIISPNVTSILLGWDGLGLVSYLLVIYHQNMRSYGAGMLTVLSNRIGEDLNQRLQEYETTFNRTATFGG